MSMCGVCASKLKQKPMNRCFWRQFGASDTVSKLRNFTHRLRHLNHFVTKTTVRWSCTKGRASLVAKRILLIEDDTDLYSLLKYNLEKEGFAFAGSQTGRGALDLCRRVRPDLVLLDIMLPDSDGLDICKGIRNVAQLAQTPIIFLTARASETDRIVGLELGANAYIVKPFIIRELIARINLQYRTQTAPQRLLK